MCGQDAKALMCLLCLLAFPLRLIALPSGCVQLQVTEIVIKNGLHNKGISSSHVMSVLEMSGLVWVAMQACHGLHH